jgi:hypothetical protein
MELVLYSHFEAFEQTLRLRLVSGPVDKKFFFLWGIACPVQHVLQFHVNGGGNLILREYGNRGPRRYRIL